MARLAANGAELLRVELEKDHPHNELIDWSRITRTFHRRTRMSGLHSLEKRDVHFRLDGTFSGRRRHCYGWKRRGKCKSTMTLESIRAKYKAAGWRIIRFRMTAADPEYLR